MPASPYPRSARRPADGRHARSSTLGDAAAPSAPVHPFRPHYAAGAPPFSGLRPTPTRASSLSDPITGPLNDFAARTGNGAWPNLPRTAVATRLTELARDPWRLDQAGLNACGPAAALYLFGKRQPERFVNFAIELYENGQAPFGSMTVSGSGLFSKDPSAMNWSGNAPALCDWMLLSSTLRSAGDILRFSGEPSDAASGITLPGEMEDWLRDGLGYRSVSNDANKFFTKGLDHLKGLTIRDNRDAVMLINVTRLRDGGTVTAPRTRSQGALVGAVQGLFPDHWMVLERPVVESGPANPGGLTDELLNTFCEATCWTWGQSGYKFKAPNGVWAGAYYGAITCEV